MCLCLPGTTTIIGSLPERTAPATKAIPSSWIPLPRFRLYSKDTNKDVLTDSFIRSRLTETGREDFPFYLPHQKHIGFLRFSVKDIPDSIPEGE